MGVNAASILSLLPIVAHPFWVFDWAQVWQAHVLQCSFALLLSGVLCSAAGIGGGGIYVTVLMVVGGLSPHDGVPLSKAIVFFGSMSSLVLNMRRSLQMSAQGQPLTVIDYTVCRLVVPASLIGTLGGVLLNHEMDERIIVLLLTAILVFMTLLTASKAYEQYLAEKASPKASQHEDLAQDVHSDENDPLLPESQQKHIVDNHKVYPLKPFGSVETSLAGLTLFLVALCGIMRFHARQCSSSLSGAVDDGHQYGWASACEHPIVTSFFGAKSLGTWLADPLTSQLVHVWVLAAPICVCIGLCAYYGAWAMRHQGWTMKGVLGYQSMGVFTGCIAGLVGVGGGLIFSPFFLITGMDPSMAVGTSATCVIFTSSSTTVQYLFTDRIIMSLALVYGLVNLAASYAGTSLVHLLQDRFGARKSYITLIVLIGVAISAVLSVGKFISLLESPIS